MNNYKVWLVLLSITWAAAIGACLYIWRPEVYDVFEEDFEDPPAAADGEGGATETPLDASKLDEGASATTAGAATKGCPVLVEVEEEEEVGKKTLIWGEFIKRLNKRIGGDWKKNGCKLKSVTIDSRSMKVKATCKKGVAPKKAIIRRCKSTSLNFYEKRGVLTCGPRVWEEVQEEALPPSITQEEQPAVAASAPI